MFYKIGHRGAAGYATENTLESFKKALELNVDMIELDAHICKSKEVVVIHNKDTKKINKRKDQVIKQNYADLKKIKIPTLENVLDLINRKAKINIELKGKNTAEPVAKIVKNYIDNKKWHRNDFLISSFSKKELEKFIQYLPQIKIGFLINPLRPYSLWIKRFPFIFKKHLHFAKKINSFSINIHKKIVNQKIVAMAHKEKIKIFVYTVNQKKEIQHLKDIGVDGIFSDYPDRL
ncbi:MAG: glycerophosphodiester phosphodiesterase [Parcubacteria group bacterium]|jgi:glycerophosphoryl diester phosphodiesterase